MNKVADIDLKRREFLVNSGSLALAATPILSFSSKLFGALTLKEVEVADQIQKGVWIPSCCNMCGGQSGILVNVIDGIVRKIEPNPYNPNNFTSHPEDYFKNVGKPGVASICAKGNAGIMTLYDPDRIKKPLKRTNPKKGFDVDPGWVEISYEEALNEIAQYLKKLKLQQEAHKLLWISEDHSFTHIQSDFCKLYGTPNYYMHSNLCDTGRKASAKWVFGHDRPLIDFYNTKYMMLWGWNPLEAMKWIYLPRMINEAIERGAKLVVVDPVMSVTAMKAHRYLQIKAGTDGALALALANVIIKENLYDKEFVQKWSVGFDRFVEYVKDKTPEWASKITTIDAKVIYETAIELATTKPAAVDVWSGTHYSNGDYAGAAIFLLNALVGSVDKPGGLCIPEKKGNKHVEVKAENIPQKPVVEPEKFPFYHKSGVYGKIFTDIAKGKGPYDIKALMCVFQNPAIAVPNGITLFPEVANKLEKIFVVDILMSETALFADIVLPGSTYLERYDLNTHWVLWPALGLRQPVVKPIFGQLTEYEIVIELGRRLGLKEADGNDFFYVSRMSGQKVEDKTKWYEDYLSKELKEGEPKISLEELKALPGAVWVAPANKWKYQKYAQTIDITSPSKPGLQIKVENDIVYEIDPNEKDEKKAKKAIGIMIDGVAYKGFDTKTRKIEFYSKWAEGKKDALGNPLEPLPAFYKELDPAPNSDYPLICINWKEALHTHSRSQNNRWLLELKPTNTIYIHPDTATRYGVTDGEEILVVSPWGKAKGRAFITKRIHPLVIGALHGFGRLALGKAAKAAGGFAGSSALNKPGHYSGISGQALNKHVIVRIEKIQY
jgi:thiosulfate reductase / polysulfide reductase chain A